MQINYSDEKVLKGEKSIFLAGPTPRSLDVETWRKEAIRILEELGFDGIVYVPELEHDDRTMTIKCGGKEKHYIMQVLLYFGYHAQYLYQHLQLMQNLVIGQQETVIKLFMEDQMIQKEMNIQIGYIKLKQENNL